MKEGELCLTLMRLGTHLATVFDRQMAALGLTQAQFRFLANLWQQPLSPAELARRTLLERPSVSLVAQRMVAAGWLERIAGANRRTHLLQLTPAGRELLQASLPTALAMAAQTTAVFSEEEKDLLQALLSRLEGGLRQVPSANGLLAEPPDGRPLGQG